MVRPGKPHGLSAGERGATWFEYAHAPQAPFSNAGIGSGVGVRPNPIPYVIERAPQVARGDIGDLAEVRSCFRVLCLETFW